LVLQEPAKTVAGDFVELKARHEGQTIGCKLNHQEPAHQLELRKFAKPVWQSNMFPESPLALIGNASGRTFARMGCTKAAAIPCVRCGCTLLNIGNVSSTWNWFSVR
jgi:hypothetical protein